MTHDCAVDVAVQRLLNVTLVSQQPDKYTVCPKHQTTPSLYTYMQLALLLILTAHLLPATTMSDQRTSADARQGIPAITDPAAVDQDQYGKMAQGASLGAGSGAALGESGQLASSAVHSMLHCTASDAWSPCTVSGLWYATRGQYWCFCCCWWYCCCCCRWCHGCGRGSCRSCHWSSSGWADWSCGWRCCGRATRTRRSEQCSWITRGRLCTLHCDTYCCNATNCIIRGLRVVICS
jgi:hypothetical protein